MKSKRILSILMAVGLAITPATSVMAREVKAKTVETKASQLESKYKKFSGQVIDLRKDKSGLLYVTIAKYKNNELGDLLIKLPKDALIYRAENGEKVKREDIKKGDTLDVYLDEKTPMTKSIPGQAVPQVVVINNKVKGKMDKTTKVDRFNKKLVSRDELLELNISKNTHIVDIRGKKMTAKDLVDRDLLVIYDITTKSIPAQTSPLNVVILGDSNKKLEVFNSVYINGRETWLKKPMYNQKGEIMVPLRELAEELGYKVKWNNKTRSIELNKGAVWSSMKIASKDYGFSKMILRLNQAPVIKNNNTYVPLNYFNEVLQLDLRVVDGILNISK